MSEPFIGEIRAFPYTFAPRFWANCDGQPLQIAQHSALFSIIGTTYGGDGRTSFQLPKLNGRAAMGSGTGPGLPISLLGQNRGANTITLQPSQLPTHNHEAEAELDFADQGQPAGSFVAAYLNSSGSGVFTYKETPSAPKLTEMSPQALAPAGGGYPHNNMHPYLPLRYCIALVGIYPSRN